MAARIITASIGLCLTLFGLVEFLNVGSVSWKSGAALIGCVLGSTDLLQGAIRGKWPVFALLLFTV